MSKTRVASVVTASIALLVSVTLVFVGSEAPARVAQEAPTAQGSKAKARRLTGIDLTNLNPAADPCTDFDAFVNGAWQAANPIPDGAQRWSRRTAAREANRQQLKTLLEELAAKPDRPRGSIEQQLGDHFAACMDEKAIDAAGVDPLKPLLSEIATIQDAKGVDRMIRRLHDLAVPALFAVTAASDYHDPESVVASIAAGALGLPDRDYYLKPEQRFAEAREKYRAHVTRALTLAGMAAAQAPGAASDILALETRLAEESLPPAVAADPAATAHKMTFAQLEQLAGHFGWETYFEESSLPRTMSTLPSPGLSSERIERWRQRRWRPGRPS